MKSINQKINNKNFTKIRKSLKNTKSILINETSVYKEYAILKNKAVTSENHFDLIQIPNLRMYAGEFLRSARLRLNLSQKELSERYNIPKSTLRHMEKERCAIALTTIVDIVKDCGLSKDDVYKLIEEKRISTKKNVNLLFKYEDCKEILPFISKQSNGRLLIKHTGKKLIGKISELFNVKIYQSTNKQFVIRNIDLYNFFNTFFDQIVIKKIDPPLTNFAKRARGIDLRKAMICPLLQTDGSGCFDKKKNMYFVSFKNISKELHNIFVDSIYLAYNKFLPGSYLLKEKLKDKKYSECFVTKYTGTEFQPIYKDLIKLCGNFKTSIYHTQSIEDYNKEPKPHLNYLLNAKKIEKILAFRIWASTEGAIIPMRRSKGGLIVPKLQVSCANKKLLFQLKKVVSSIGLHFSIRKETGMGYKCLYNMAISCVLSFLKLGGFIEGIKISKSSQYYEGIDKQYVAYATLEHMMQERKDSSLRKLSMKEVHKRIRKIAENKEFKNINHYIKFFSQNEKVQKCLNY